MTESIGTTLSFASHDTKRQPVTKEDYENLNWLEVNGIQFKKSDDKGDD